jgi:hypothetical protein
VSKKRILVLGAILLGFTLFVSGQEQPSQQDQQKMMEAYKKMSALNENHEYLKYFVGEWDVTSRAWMFPGSEPVVSQSTSKADLILGGRFLKMLFKGTMFGQPFQGLQIVGYDNLQKKHITFWIDNSSTAFFLSTGSRDESGKVITDTGERPDPMTGGVIKVRAVNTLVNKDEFTYELYMTGPDGKEFKSLENSARRKQQK